MSFKFLFYHGQHNYIISQTTYIILLLEQKNKQKQQQKPCFTLVIFLRD